MIPREVQEELAEATLALWYTAAGLDLGYMRELLELEFPRGPESCGWIDLTGEARS